MGKQALALGAAFAVAVAVTASAAHGAEPAIVNARNVLPPGQSGNPASPHFDDQLRLYTSWQFKDMPLDPPASATVETPIAGIRIYRDAWGVPYVVAATDADAAYGVGYAEAADRFEQMDVLRHQVEGRLAELIPPSSITTDQQAELVAGDVAARRAAPADADLLHELKARPLVDRVMMRAFANGVNAWISDNTAAGTLPLEYVLLGTPARWRPVDSLQIAAYMAHNFGQAGGQELRTSAMLTALRSRFSRTRANAYFDDVVWRGDAAAPTTIPSSVQTFTYPTGGLGGLGASGVAIPDAAPTPTGPQSRGNGPLPLGLRHLASNTIAISRKLSLTGHNLLMGGPQVGQYYPQIVLEMAIKGATIHSRGMTFPGIGPVVLIGRTRSHAWSFTSGEDDQTDTWAQLLNPAHPNQYRFNGRWETLATRTETILRRTSSGTAVAKTIAIESVGHGHGTVIARGTIAKRKVAFSRGSTVDGNELSILGPVFELNRDRGWAKIRGQLPAFSAGFNMMYADHARIAYYHLGWYPVRAANTDARLPTWGNGLHEWHGIVPFRSMPHLVNPSQGWLANWNNRPIAGWNNGDSTPWGGQTRVTMLQDQLVGARNVTLTKLRRVIQNAAYLDARVKEFRPIALAAVDTSRSTLVQNAADALAAWDGNRVDTNNDGSYDSPGVTILDRWWTELQTDVLRSTLGKTAFDLSGDSTFDEEFWGADRASLLLHVLRGSASSVPLEGPWPKGAALTVLVAKAFTDTVTALQTTYHTTDVTRWLEPRANFSYTAFSTLITPPVNVAHMNRGTYNQLIELG